MEVIGSNIKYLRKQKGLTQDELAKNIGIKRAVIGSYEENRASPKLSVLKDLAVFFDVSMDELASEKLWETPGSSKNTRVQGEGLRVLSTTVDPDNNELITTVPIQASAGYQAGYSDPEYIEELPHFSLPLIELNQQKSYRIFQIKGDSMLPIQSGSYIICEYQLNWDDIQDGNTYIVISKDEGIVYKRLYNKIRQSEEIILKSDNKEYHDYTLNVDEIHEIWKALGFISFSLPETNSSKEVNVDSLHQMVLDMQKDLEKLKK